MKTLNRVYHGAMWSMILVSALVVLGCTGSPEKSSDNMDAARPVKSMVVRSESPLEVRTFPGVVKAARETELAFRVSGPLIAYDIRVGQKVAKGDVIARIDPRDFKVAVSKVSAALAHRPLMKLLAISMKQLDQSLTLAKSSLYPTVSLVGRYEQSGDSFEANTNDYTNDHNASVHMEASWTFFQGGKVLSETRKVKRQMSALTAGIDRHRNQIREEVHSAVLDCRTASNNIETASKALDQARENWRTTDLQYKQQVATATDVLDARAFLTQADSNYYRALYGYLNAVAALDRAVGKGQHE